MSNGHAIRGTRIGANPGLHSERGEPVPRQSVTFWCANGHETVRSFALYIDLPNEWDCTRCGWLASRDSNNPPGQRTVKPYKSHLTYVRERRSEEEAEDLLAEALAARAARRGERHLPAQTTIPLPALGWGSGSGIPTFGVRTRSA